jgi:hypothetical protein
MAKRFSTLSDYFDRGPETQQQFADRLTRKYGIRISQASVSEAVKHGRGSYDRLMLYATESGVPFESFRRLRVAA